MGRTGANASGDTVDTASSLPRPVPHIAASGSHNREDNRGGADKQQIRSADRSPTPGVPEPVPARRSNDSQMGVEEDADGGEVSQRYLHPCPDMVGSEPDQKGNGADGEEVGRVYPTSSTPSFTHIGKPGGMRTWLFQLPPLIILSENTGTSTGPNHLPEVLHPNESSELSAAADDDKLDWKSTASATAKLLLRWAKDSADAFGPLKSVTGSLCFILENFEVCPLYTNFLQCLQLPQQTKANKQAIESLAYRIEESAGTLHAPIHWGDIREESRRNALEQ